jgi:hypothetical protein
LKTINGTKLKIEVSSDKIVGYLDEEKGFEAKEGPKDGRIGFSLFGTSAAFDDVVVYDKGGLSVDSSKAADVPNKEKPIRPSFGPSLASNPFSSSRYPTILSELTSIFNLVPFIVFNFLTDLGF